MPKTIPVARRGQDREASAREHRDLASLISGSAGARSTKTRMPTWATRSPAAAPTNASTMPSIMRLLKHPRGGGTECEPQRDLALAGRAAREQKTGHVGAGDQEHEHHRSHQQEKRGPHGRHRVLLKTRDGAAAATMAGIDIGHDAHDPLHVRARLRDRLVGLQPSNRRGSCDCRAPCPERSGSRCPAVSPRAAGSWESRSAAA